MRLLARGKITAAVAVLLLLCLAPVAYAHSFIIIRFFWWQQPPTPAVQDVTFTGVNVQNGLLRTYLFTSGSPAVFALSDLDDTTVDASVASGVLTINSFTLVNTTDGITVDVTINPATLRRSIFNSTFLATGNAAVDDGSTIIDVPITVCGSISRGSSDYFLRAQSRGYQFSTSGTTRTYSFLRFDLNGSTAIP